MCVYVHTYTCTYTNMYNNKEEIMNFGGRRRVWRKRGRGKNHTDAVLMKFSKNKTTNCFKLYMEIEVENKDTSEQDKIVNNLKSGK